MKETLKNVDELYDKINQLLKSYDLLKKIMIRFWKI